MGIIEHTTLLVTNFDKEQLKAARKKAIEIFNVEDELHELIVSPEQVSNIGGIGMNGYLSFCIFSSGSKLGWGMNESYLECLEKFTEYLDKQTDDDGSSCFDYVQVSYGEFGAKVDGTNCKKLY